jgi:hypothetical protein
MGEDSDGDKKSNTCVMLNSSSNEDQASTSRNSNTDINATTKILCDFTMVTVLYTDGIRITFNPLRGSEHSGLGRLPGQLIVSFLTSMKAVGEANTLSSVKLAIEDVKTKWHAWIPLEVLDHGQRVDDVIISCQVILSDSQNGGPCN